VRLLNILLLLIACAPAGSGQQPSAQAPPSTKAIPLGGGVTQTLQSIYIPPIPNAPFTAIIHTQWIRLLMDGGTFTLVNQRQIARDSQGRIYEERWLLVPKNGNVKSRMNVIQIADPVQHTLYNCFTLDPPHRCILETLSDRLITNYTPPVLSSGPLPGGQGFRTHEDLGIQTFAGIDCQGSRDTITLNTGVAGNDRPLNQVRESWLAPGLGIDLRLVITDPAFGKEIFSVTDVSTSEPDPQLFELPAGLPVVDRRKPPTPTAPSQ
jgi:hypothetical protein